MALFHFNFFFNKKLIQLLNQIVESATESIMSFSATEYKMGGTTHVKINIPSELIDTTTLLIDGEVHHLSTVLNAYRGYYSKIHAKSKKNAEQYQKRKAKATQNQMMSQSQSQSQNQA